MQKIDSSRPYGFRQKYFQRFQKIISFVAMATTVFEGIKFFQFHQNPISSVREGDV